jgi:hypothetical protein
VNKIVLVRLAAFAAIAGGLLRVANGLFTASATPQMQQFAYFCTDVLLLLGLCGIYLTRSERLGVLGLVGFVTALVGILMVRSSALSLFGFSAYLAGASVTLFGVVMIAIAMLLKDSVPKLAPILWIISLLIGVAGLFPLAMSWGVTLAGVTFGAGFAAAGISLLSGKSA